MIAPLGRSCATRLCWTLLIAFAWSATSHAAVLVADRLTNRVLKYSNSGAFVGVVIDDQVNLNQPNGMIVSPDGSKLYVASRNSSRVVRYDFNGAVGANPLSIASNGASTINVPASFLFAPDGNTLYVSNLGPGNSQTVAQLTPDGVSAGPDLGGGPATGRSGLALSPTGAILASSFGAGAAGGGVLRFDATANSWVDFVPQTTTLRGAGNLVVNGNDLYVAAGFAGTLRKYDATTGAIDAAFAVDSLAFPASLTSAPGGGLLVGILGATNGSGRIDRYGFDGTLLGTFANNSNADPSLGFREATGLLFVVPEPSVVTIVSLGLAATAAALRRRARPVSACAHPQWTSLR